MLTLLYDFLTTFLSLSRNWLPLNALWLLQVSPGLTGKNYTFFPQNTFVCLVWISKNKQRFFMYPKSAGCFL